MSEKYTQKIIRIQQIWKDIDNLSKEIDKLTEERVKLYDEMWEINEGGKNESSNKLRI